MSLFVTHSCLDDATDHGETLHGCYLGYGEEAHKVPFNPKKCAGQELGVKTGIVFSG